MLKNKKILIAVLVAVVAIVATIFTFFQKNLGGASGGTVAYVDTISNIMGFSGGGNDRYSGVVESQQSVKVNKNQEKKIEQVFVSVGDQVIPSTVLFRYDVSEAQKQISSINLEIESLNGTIADKNKAISDARNDGINVEQISIFENEIRGAQLSIQQKQLELAAKQKEIDTADVLANTNGIIKAINESGTDAQGNTTAFIEISQSGEFRVKGTIDETSITSISLGQEMIVRSRTDETKFWTGKITEIKTEPNAKQNDMYSMGGSSSSEKASTYPFYISLDSSDGLMLGQHVYLEKNNGTAVKKDGIWLDASYVVMEGEKAYLWVANKNHRLEKREVEVGELDQNLYQYEIKSGVSESDSIAWPMEDYKEGMKTESISTVGSGE